MSGYDKVLEKWALAIGTGGQTNERRTYRLNHL